MKKFDRIRAKLLGALGYITKPFSAEALITMVDLVILTQVEKASQNSLGKFC